MSAKQKKHLFGVVCLLLSLSVVVAIYCFSAQVATKSSHTSGSVIRYLIKLFWKDYAVMTAAQQTLLVAGFQNIVRKLAHFSIFSALGFFSFGAAYGLLTPAVSPTRAGLLAGGFCLLNAVSDELHQLFVPGRACRMFDVLVDSGGAAVGILFMSFCVFVCIRYRHRRQLSREKIDEARGG